MTREGQLTDWIESKHEGQLIKCTREPYFDHLVAVAEMCGPALAFGYELGLCHDVFEKTRTSQNELCNVLIDFGYNRDDARYIVRHVLELTDVFTRKAFPWLKKASRKAKESARLLTISAASQTVKYCDLIYNIGWVLKYDPGKAVKYLKSKQLLLAGMTAGDPVLRQQAIEMINKALCTLKVRDQENDQG